MGVFVDFVLVLPTEVEYCTVCMYIPWFPLIGGPIRRAMCVSQSFRG